MGPGVGGPLETARRFIVRPTMRIAGQSPGGPSPKQSLRELRNVSNRESLLHHHPLGESSVGRLPVLSLCALVGLFPEQVPRRGGRPTGQAPLPERVAANCNVSVLPSRGSGQGWGSGWRVTEVKQASPSHRLLRVELCPPQWHSQVPVHKTSEWGLMQNRATAGVIS